MTFKDRDRESERREAKMERRRCYLEKMELALLMFLHLMFMCLKLLSK